MKCINCANFKNEWCEKVVDAPYPDIERDCYHFVPMTNAQKIRAMTDEELADWIEAVSPYEEYCGCCPAEGFCNTSYKEMECKDIVSLWLKQPCGGADHA